MKAKHIKYDMSTNLDDHKYMYVCINPCGGGKTILAMLDGNHKIPRDLNVGGGGGVT